MPNRICIFTKLSLVINAWNRAALLSSALALVSYFVPFETANAENRSYSTVLDTPVTIARPAQWNRDCEADGVPKIEFKERPSNGSTTLTPGIVVVNRIITRSGRKNDCFGKSMQGLHMVYTPRRGFVGTDHVSFRLTLHGRNSVTDNITIQVIAATEPSANSNSVAGNTAAVARNTQATSENTDAIARSIKAANENNSSITRLTDQIANATEVNSVNAAVLNRRIGYLGSQIDLLTKVLQRQQDLSKTAEPSIRLSIDATIVVINKRIADLKRQYGEQEPMFARYLTSIQPNDRDLYLTARKASENYPKIPYFIPGTSETGEFWVEPTVTDKGEMSFGFKFIDLGSPIEKVRGVIQMNLSEIESTQKALSKLYDWSNIAHDNKLRKAYEKRVTCFPLAECPPDGEQVENKSSTEIRFNVYEDGSTAGRIQRNKGRFVEGYNISIESAQLLQCYLEYVIAEAKLEFKSGTQDKKAIDTLFQ